MQNGNGSSTIAGDVYVAHGSNACQSEKHEVPGLGSMHPATCQMRMLQTSDPAPGRAYKDSHVECCPWINGQELFKDQIFNFEGWQRHKSWHRHAPDWWTLIRIILYYWPPLLVVFVISISIGIYQTLRHPSWPNLSQKNWVPPFQLMGFVLSLLLVFRTNSSYGRWWEARIQWGTLIELTRDLMRETLTFAGQDDAPLIDMVGRWTIAMPYVLKAHLTELTDLNVQLRGVLLPHELDILHRCSHRPSITGQALSDAINALNTHPFKALTINTRVSQYYHIVAACERLYKQPIPSGYTRHTSRFLVTWCGLLPFALWQDCQWITPFVAVLIAFLLLGVENIGVQIEQPFSVLPLEKFCTTIRDNIIEQLQIRMRSGDLLWRALDMAHDADTPMATNAQRYSRTDAEVAADAADGHSPSPSSSEGSFAGSCSRLTYKPERSVTMQDRRASFHYQQAGLKTQFLATEQHTRNAMTPPPLQQLPQQGQQHLHRSSMLSRVSSVLSRASSVAPSRNSSQTNAQREMANYDDEGMPPDTVVNIGSDTAHAS